MQVWIVSAVLGCVFLAEGVTKLFGLPLQVELFHRFDLPDLALPLVGALEIGLAALLLSRSTRSYGAIGMACVLIADSFALVMTHLMLPMLFVNVTLGLAAGWLVLRHRPGFLQVRRHA